MAGHSKWANIQHRKKKQDAKRGKLFTKLIREITVAARMGGEDQSGNPRLRDAVTKALSNNMTRETVDRAIKRGAGNTDDSNFEEVRYEGYGPGGVAVIVDCLTDNRNRTVGEVRHVFTKLGGNLGTDGSVAYLFSKQGQISFAPGSDEEKIMEMAIEAGAEDVLTNDDDSILVVTAPENFHEINEVLKEAKLPIAEAEITMAPSNEITLDLESAKTVVKMLDMLEDLDDVQEVYSNADIPPEAYD